MASDMESGKLLRTTKPIENLTLEHIQERLVNLEERVSDMEEISDLRVQNSFEETI